MLACYFTFYDAIPMPTAIAICHHYACNAVLAMISMDSQAVMTAVVALRDTSVRVNVAIGMN